MLAAPSKLSALRVVARMLPEGALVITANGHTSRAWRAVGPLQASLPLLGAMGQALAVAAGLDSCNPGAPVVAIEGDGNWAFGAAMAAALRDDEQYDLTHLVLRDGAHSSTGGQAVQAPVSLGATARTLGYNYVGVAEQAADILPVMRDRWASAARVAFVEVAVAADPRPPGPRVTIAPKRLWQDFCASATS